MFNKIQNKEKYYKYVYIYREREGERERECVSEWVSASAMENFPETYDL